MNEGKLKGFVVLKMSPKDFCLTFGVHFVIYYWFTWKCVV